MPCFFFFSYAPQLVHPVCHSGGFLLLLNAHEGKRSESTAADCILPIDIVSSDAKLMFAGGKKPATGPEAAAMSDNGRLVSRVPVFYPLPLFPHACYCYPGWWSKNPSISDRDTVMSDRGPCIFYDRLRATHRLFLSRRAITIAGG